MTVCINTVAEINCGFSGASPSTVIPDWRIVYRSDNGSVISNVTIDGGHISSQLISGLQWVADFNGGILSAPNSKLLVGPVNMTHNQSLYQCMFTINERGGGSNTVMSNVGTMTVLGKIHCNSTLAYVLYSTDSPSVIINFDETCTTSINISLNTISDPACGDVSHNVTISGNPVDPDSDSKYIIDGLQSNTLYNITVISRFNYNGFRTFNRSVRTSSLKCKKHNLAT